MPRLHGLPTLEELASPGSGEPFCFIRHRMKHVWRRADARFDSSGRPVDGTIGASRARRHWAYLLTEVLMDDRVIRIRRQCEDEGAVLMSESRYRALETAALGALRPRGREDPARRRFHAWSR